MIGERIKMDEENNDNVETDRSMETSLAEETAEEDPCLTGMNSRDLASGIVSNLFYLQATLPEMATRNDWYLALAYSVRERMLKRWIQTQRAIMLRDVKVVAYLSAEFLMGPHLANNLLCLGIYDEVREATEILGLNLDELIEQEEEPGLGNGGLGRLAACFMDSLATLEIPAIGYGIRYEFGIFDQVIKDGWQVEITDKWLQYGNPWEITRPDVSYYVKFGGRTESYYDDQGRYRVNWSPNHVLKGVAYDTPIAGYRVNNTNLLRLWKAEAVESFDFDAFNTGDYLRAVNEKVISENLTKILYPNDSTSQGRRLRLEQQYFFVSCSLQNMIQMHLSACCPLNTFPERFAAQLNDTHPSIAVAELMRLLVDEHLLDWDAAWDITTRTLSYTNHTLMPEALERWPLPMFGNILPRHLEIIYEINKRLLDEVRLKFPGDEQRVERSSLIDESDGKFVRMANLASVGSHAINGVAVLHTKLVEQLLLRDFYGMSPEKFHNVTNGVTPRRWMMLSNPKLAGLITEAIGDRWIRYTEEELSCLEPYAENAAFRQRWQEAMLDNKKSLAGVIKDRTGVVVDPDSMFDIQVKRIHEYKRQHLNLLYIITLYNRLKRSPGMEVAPRTFIFGGKAAPGYWMAKLIIKLIHSVAEVVNNDPDVNDLLRVVFFPDFNVKNAQHIYPAADLSEQLSTAGMEASGTGNMKFAMNGALTIGTLDGANVEIREAVGAENFFLFGLTVDEVFDLRAKGYNPWDYYKSNEELRVAVNMISEGVFSMGDSNLFRPLVDSLIWSDPYLLFADYQSYLDKQEEVCAVYRDRDLWAKKSILTVARMGRFSSDRSIRQYCSDIWNAKPVKVNHEE